MHNISTTCDGFVLVSFLELGTRSEVQCRWWGFIWGSI